VIQQQIHPELLSLFIRDESICWLCNKPVTREQASRDHVIPKSLGGPNHLENYKLAHKDCNSYRGNSEVLPSREEVVAILTKIQGGICFKCQSKKVLTCVIIRNRSVKSRVLRIVCHSCGTNEKKARGFGLNQQIQLKKIRVNEKKVPMEMSVIDTILALQLEENDYARFHDINGALRSGNVLLVDDMGDEIDVTMHDDELDESVIYTVRATQTVELLGYAAMAV
jgi:hypothetical protein